MYSQSVDGHLLAQDACSDPEPEPEALLEKWPSRRDFFLAGASALLIAASLPRVMVVPVLLAAKEMSSELWEQGWLTQLGSSSACGISNQNGSNILGICICIHVHTYAYVCTVCIPASVKNL